MTISMLYIFLPPFGQKGRYVFAERPEMLPHLLGHCHLSRCVQGLKLSFYNFFFFFFNWSFWKRLFSFFHQKVVKSWKSGAASRCPATFLITWRKLWTEGKNEVQQRLRNATQETSSGQHGFHPWILTIWA